MKLAVGLIIKNGEQFVDKWIKSAERIADIFLIVDNGLKEGERKRLMNHSKTKQYLIQKNMGRNQSRDYQKILEMAREENCDWVWNLDIDEYVPEIDINQFRFYLLNCEDESIGFPLFEMRNDDKHYIAVKDTDGKYKHARLCHKCYKVLSHLEFDRRDIHGKSIPHNCKTGKAINVLIQHFGHYTKELREEKRKQYEGTSFKDLNEQNAPWLEEDEDKIIIKRWEDREWERK